MKHTHGEWKVNNWIPSRLKVSINPESPVLETNICSIYGDGDNQEMKANAKLIAAAPELLEALKGLIHSVEHEGAIHGRVGFAVWAAKEAIKKATE